MPCDTRPWLVVLLCGGLLLVILVTVGPFVGGKPRPTETVPDKEEVSRRILGIWTTGADSWKTLAFTDNGYRLTVMNDGGPRTPDEDGEYALLDGEILELRPAPFQAEVEPMKDKDLPAPSAPGPRPARRYAVHVQGDELHLITGDRAKVWRRKEN